MSELEQQLKNISAMVEELIAKAEALSKIQEQINQCMDIFEKKLKNKSSVATKKTDTQSEPEMPLSDKQIRHYIETLERLLAQRENPRTNTVSTQKPVLSPKQSKNKSNQNTGTRKNAIKEHKPRKH
jgi:hypothetical protein